MIRSIFYQDPDLPQTVHIGIFAHIFSIFLWVLPICFLVGGIAFRFLKNWGRVLVLISLTVDFLIWVGHIVNFWYVSFITKQPSVIPESTIPLYVIATAEIVALYFITRPKIKELFLH